MAKALAPPPKFTVYLNGSPASGAKVYTYEGGSVDTPITTYSDYDGTANANPVICDSRGECNLWLSPAVSYKLVVKDSSDNTIYTVDDIIGPSGSGSEIFTSITVTGNGSVFEGSVTFESTVNFEGDTTITLEEGEEFLVTGEGDTIFETDVTFLGDVDMSNAENVEYLDGSIDIADLSPELLALILSAGGGGAGGGNTITSGDGRLSLATGVKVMIQDYAAQATVYYVGGVILNFNDGNDTFQPFNTGELSQALASATYSPAAAVAAKNYDMFGWKRAIVVASITRSTTVATVTTTGNHNITTGAVVYIAGAAQSEYNGYKTLTGGSGTTFTFTVDSGAVTPATGSITCHTATLSRGPAWDSDTVRGTGAGKTAIVLVGSTYTNVVDITNGPGAGLGTYVGSIMTDAGGATVTWKLGTGDNNGGEAWLGVWNVSNRSFTGTAVQDTDASWTVATGGAVIGPMNASATWRSTMITGLNDSIVQVDMLSQAFPPATGSAAGVAIGLDSTTTIVPRCNTTSGGNGGATTVANFSVNGKWNGFIGLGKHYLQALQVTNNASGSSTFYGLYGSGIYQSTLYTYSFQ